MIVSFLLLLIHHQIRLILFSLVRCLISVFHAYISQSNPLVVGRVSCQLESLNSTAPNFLLVPPTSHYAQKIPLFRHIKSSRLRLVN